MAEIILIYGVLVNSSVYAECIGKTLNELSSHVNSSSKIITSNGSKASLNWCWTCKPPSEPRCSEESPRKYKITEFRGDSHREMLTIGYIVKIFCYSNNFGGGQIYMDKVWDAREEYKQKLQDLSKTDKKLYELLSKESACLRLIPKF
jgi:hypothetical protein